MLCIRRPGVATNNLSIFLFATYITQSRIKCHLWHIFSARSLAAWPWLLLFTERECANGRMKQPEGVQLQRVDTGWANDRIVPWPMAICQQVFFGLFSVRCRPDLRSPETCIKRSRTFQFHIITHHRNSKVKLIFSTNKTLQRFGRWFFLSVVVVVVAQGKLLQFAFATGPINS